uniref:Non-structural maintenance of chromosomes element 4 n=1 Tax=Pyramimonas obovata TaxID=1411642 RepID=A0A7S0WSW1_9CHLO|mmetsp:Transcript_38392/g.83523  ORF Transcript_38392/g.83523 Transcript_38392/m.83523 type:complete len:355 (+) Transcript_38392:67-1131(+)
MSLTDRRELRQAIRKLTKETTDEKAKLINADGQGSARLIAKVDQADELFTHVKKTREMAVDSELFYQFTGCGLELSKGARPGVTGFTPQRFLARLKSLYVPGWTAQTRGASCSEVFRWEELGTKSGHLFSTVPSFTCMYGPMSLQVKERRVPQRRQKQQPAGELVNPEQVTSTSDAKQQETDKNMNKMNKILKTVKHVSMARLINNPRSFAQTVENMFTLSFLVRDGRAELIYGEDGSIEVVVAGGSPTDEEYASGDAEVTQIVKVFTIMDWQEMQQYVGEPAFLVPHREYDEDGLMTMGATHTQKEEPFPPGGEDSPGEQVRLVSKGAKAGSRHRPRGNSSQDEDRPQKRTRG